MIPFCLRGLAPILALATGIGGAHAQDHPVEVANCFETARFAAPPKRPMVHDTNMTQTMLDLGLADRLVAVSGIEGAEHRLIAPPGVVEALPRLPDRSPSLEAVLSADPDFLFAGWSYGFSEARGLTPARLAEMGVATYTLRESCIRIGPREPIGMDTLYADLLALGNIFGIAERAEAMVADFRRRVAAVTDRTGTIADRPRVMYCDHCHTDGAPVSVGREGMTSLLMELAGGRNIFDDIPNSYVRVSWEEMVRRDPQWIIVSDHRVPAEAAIRHLTAAPQLADVEAVRKRQFIVLTYAEQTPSTRNVEALERMARTLHPERFAP
ncbi:MULTISPECIES: ABC transporter substrate-binding protein [Azospirillum]|uniref:ABC transporter substrate-binding protein n=1 Tax=Azospirillum brasilense TaxID=192 RepID=A0ABU4PE63_AZOBR|nr:MULTISPECIES: ABC transporter substrate-binding protein [Azospirillum]ALJ39336.1 iron complex transporter substrate-binding protein [Azospirillum brasilense]MDX5955888.1 ABC transporter substrate-binding protein [Azospirillum brasilense]PWC96462.1 iron complex transporter substrate-binding protein [Azospirillum sp. Sp 7]